MKLLHHDIGRHAFPVQLSQELASKGHDVVHLIGANNNTPIGKNCSFFSDGSYQCEAIDTGQTYQKYSLIRRWIQEQKYSKLLSQKIIQEKPDVFLECTGPTDTHRVALGTCKRLRIPYVYWLQDINGIAASRILKKKLPVIGGVIGQYYMRMEKEILRDSNRVVLISEDFVPIMRDWGIDPAKLYVIPNWAPISELPVSCKDNAWSRKNGYDQNYCFIYSGSLGLKHNPARFTELAAHFSNNPFVKIIVISEGLGADWLKAEKEKRRIPNLDVLPYQPFEEMPDVMGTADVLLGVLEPDAGIFSVPSKVNTYLCAGRPILLSIPPDNLAARIVLDNHAGLVVSPDDQIGWVEQAQWLYDHSPESKTMGENARRYAEEHFDIDQITAQFMHILFEW